MHTIQYGTAETVQGVKDPILLAESSLQHNDAMHKKSINFQNKPPQKLILKANQAFSVKCRLHCNDLHQETDDKELKLRMLSRRTVI